MNDSEINRIRIFVYLIDIYRYKILEIIISRVNGGSLSKRLSKNRKWL